MQKIQIKSWLQRPGLYLWLFIMYERLTGFHHGTVIAMTMLIGNSRNGQPFLVEIYMLDICKHSPLRYSLFSLIPDFATGNCKMQYFFYTPPPSSHTLTHKVSNKDNDSAMTMSINYRKFVRQARKIIEFLRIKERKKY